MNTTTLEPSFLTAALLIQDFRPRRMVACKGCLLWMALTQDTLTAAELPESVTEGSRHISGAATGALIAEGLLVAVDRVKSPNPNAKGRRLDVLQLAPGKNATARAWLVANQFGQPPSRRNDSSQMELLAV